MAETRKPDSVVWVRRWDGRATKYELFSALQFPTEEFDNSLGETILLNQRGKYYRLRVDGVWWPGGSKRLLTKIQCGDMIKEAVFE